MISEAIAPFLSSILGSYARIVCPAHVIPNAEAMVAMGFGILILGLFLIFCWILSGLTLNFTGQKYRKEYHFSLVFILGQFIPGFAFVCLEFTRNIIVMSIFLAMSCFGLYKLFQKFPALPNMIFSAIAGSILAGICIILIVMNDPSIENIQLVVGAPLLICVGAGFNVFLCRRWESIVVMISTVTVGTCMISPLIAIFASLSLPQAAFIFSVMGLASQCYLGNHMDKPKEKPADVEQPTTTFIAMPPRMGTPAIIYTA